MKTYHREGLELKKFIELKKQTKKKHDSAIRRQSLEEAAIEIQRLPANHDGMMHVGDVAAWIRALAEETHER